MRPRRTQPGAQGRTSNRRGRVSGGGAGASGGVLNDVADNFRVLHKVPGHAAECAIQQPRDRFMVLCALIGGDFGNQRASFRNINKPTLVNSVNGKDCVAEVEFNTNGKEYKIVRGIKPNIF